MNLETGMKILYVPGRWSPKVQNEYSGSDYGAYNMLKRQTETEMFLVEPLEDTPNLIEKIITKVYQIFSKKRWIKYYPSALKKHGVIVNRAIEKYQPDVIFSKYSAPMVHAHIDRPFVYMCDSSLKWTKDIWPEFSKLGFWIMEKWESRVIRECNRLITFSEESAEVIKTQYQKDPDKVSVLPIPAYIPEHILPDKKQIIKDISKPFRLLLVGKRFHLRGMDIAIETANIMNEQGYPTELRIVGYSGEDQTHVKFMGVYNKEDPQELQAYFDFFKWADLLIHPSRFHSAGIVISEAAAFGLPTITNAAGGLATSVQDDITGIVLTKHSPPSAYVEAMIALINDKDRYSRYRVAARDRFDSKLNWKIAGDKLFEIISETL